MAYNGSGVFVRVHDWTADADAAINIRADRMDEEHDGFATGLTTALTKDGQTTPTANMPMGTYRHTGVGDASARTHYAVVGQIQDGKYNWVDGGGTADAITATYAPALTALVDGQLCFVRATTANATTTPTFAPNGLTARTIVKQGGQALAAGDIRADGHELILRYDLTNTRWELLNPKLGAATTTIQKLTSGTSATYTPTTGARFIRVTIKGGGGGGSGTGTTSNTGTTGGTTSFNSVTAIGGTGGAGYAQPGIGGTGGADNSLVVYRTPGAPGGWAIAKNVGADAWQYAGGPGGGNGGSVCTISAAAGNAVANSGGGGAGGRGTNLAQSVGNLANWYEGNGGGEGEEAVFWLPATTYTYTVGAGGAGGAAGTSGYVGGDGGSGVVIVEEFY